MGMILRIASSRIVGQGDIVGRSGYFSLNLSANSVMRGRLDARRTLKSLVADLRMKKNLIDYELLWEKITDYAKATGRTTARPVLLLYYVLRSPETPSSDKMLIVAALSYLVLPIDLISAKRLPIIGWIDEAVSLVYAYKKVCRYVTPEIESEVDNILERWFPEGKYELIEE